MTTVKAPLTLSAEATFEDYLAIDVEPDKVTEVRAGISTCPPSP